MSAALTCFMAAVLFAEVYVAAKEYCMPQAAATMFMCIAMELSDHVYMCVWNDIVLSPLQDR